MFDHCRAAFFCRARVGVNCAGGIDVSLTITPKSPENTRDIHNRALVFNLLRAHQVAVFNPDRLENSIGRLQPLPTSGCGRHGNAARHTETDILSGLSLNL